MSYVSFDGLVNRFNGQIYQSRKGRLRMQLIDALYQKTLPEDFVAGARVLDAAGGLGQMSHWFLANGATVDYFDVSKEMVTQVEQQFESDISAQRLTASTASITEYHPDQTFDFVNVHAVLEWLEEPMDLLPSLCSWVAPNGYLGLMVYNENMLMLRHLMRGTLERAMSGDLRGTTGGLTPISPMNPLLVREVLEGQGFKVLRHAGIRSWSDLAEKTVVDWYDEHAVFTAELKLCEQRPYCDIARYVLFIAQKTG